jgi:hypothetical protein
MSAGTALKGICIGALTGVVGGLLVSSAASWGPASQAGFAEVEEEEEEEEHEEHEEHEEEAVAEVEEVDKRTEAPLSRMSAGSPLEAALASEAAAQPSLARAPIGADRAAATRATPRTKKSVRKENMESDASATRRGRSAETSPTAELPSEIELLREIRRAIQRQDERAALRAIDEHVARFGDSGKLVQEREASRIEALCRLGRLPEVDAASTRFLANWPQSPHASGVKRGC